MSAARVLAARMIRIKVETDNLRDILYDLWRGHPGTEHRAGSGRQEMMWRDTSC